MNLGEKIKQARENNKMTQQDLASQLCVSRPTIYAWEHDIKQPRKKILNKIMKLLKLDIHIFSLNEQAYPTTIITSLPSPPEEIATKNSTADLPCE